MEFFIKVFVHRVSVLSRFLFATVINVITEKVRKGVFQRILYADDFVLIRGNMESIQRKFASWKESLESKNFKIINLKQSWW